MSLLPSSFQLRRALIATSALALGMGLSAPVLAQAAKKPKVALVMKSLANEFFLTMENGAKEHQKTNAGQYDLVTNGIKNETDTGEQIRIVEQMLVARVDALVIAPADSKALVPVLKKAIDAGVIVVNIDNRLDEATLKDKSLSIPFVGPDNRKGARLVGDVLARQLKAGDDVAIIEGVSTTFNAQQRSAGFKDAMEAAKVHVVAVQSGDWEINKANAVTSALLTANPKLRAVLCGNDSMALGAVAAVKAAGKTGQVLVAGYDNISAVQPMIADGRLVATADQFAARQAVFGIETALRAVAGKTPQGKLAAVIETPVEAVSRK